jgi:WD40 repeat protein
LAVLRGHSKSVRGLTLLNDANLISVCMDATVKMWNLTGIYDYPSKSNLIPVDE